LTNPAFGVAFTTMESYYGLVIQARSGESRDKLGNLRRHKEIASI